MNECKQSRRSFLWTVGLGATGCLAAGAMTGKRVRASRPNVIFIITDDQKRTEFNATPEGRGRNLSPNLDSMVAGGTWFTQMYAASSVCTPTRYNCMTGAYASRCASSNFARAAKKNLGQTSVQWNTFIDFDTPHIGRALQAAGYLTGFVGKSHTHALRKHTRIAWNADPADPEIDRILKKNQTDACEDLRKHGFDYAASIYHGNIPTQACKALNFHNTDWIVKGALDFIEAGVKNSKPFFLHMATTITHGPGAAGKRYAGNPLATPAGLLKAPLTVMPPRDTIPKRLKKAGINRKAADILWLDDGLGAILKKLKALKIADNTVIILFNDHGADGGAKGSLYQGGARSEGLIYGTGKKGHRVSQLVQNIDFAPTILELCGVPRSDWPKMDGVSLTPLLAGGDNPVHKSLYFEIGDSRAVIKDGWKYLAVRHTDRINKMSLAERKRLLDAATRNHAKVGKKWKVTDPEAPFAHMGNYPGGNDGDQRCIAARPHYFDPDQLFDLSKDPGEKKNLAKIPKHAGRLEEMKKELTAHLANLPGGFGEFKL
ncbi:MAG: sulfatase-like hydrolase/transferase [Phycisphaerae bacterium]|jgi:arylsulfatase A-like enzyme|nr:sulfatase-like hydrolase/transferase [Phycisphaerae bacterium]